MPLELMFQLELALLEGCKRFDTLRQAAATDCISTGTASAAQIEFVDMVIEHLTDQGVMHPALLYEPPFTGIAPTGPEHLFDESNVVKLFETIKAINASAVA